MGRIATIDKDGFPQIIPMNFVFLNGMIYMHSHPVGEKLANVQRNSKTGFEVDRELEFLPSYFSHPTDASLADTLYVSVVIKGTSMLVTNREEKSAALNGLMQKYQPEGRYEPLRPEMQVVDEVAVIRIVPDSLRGKYKVGQQLNPADRADLARKILKRRPGKSKATLKAMGFVLDDGKLVMNHEPAW